MPRQNFTSTPAGSFVHRRLCFFLAFTLLAGLCGCASGMTKKEASVKSAKKLKSSAAELSSRNQSLLALYSGEIEAAADKIMRESKSRVTRRHALEWKTEAIPVLQNSLLKSDPITALADTWVFIFQMTDYMAQPAVREQFGDSHSVVDETLKTMNTQMEQLIQTAAPGANVSDFRQKLGAWGREHPIQTGISARQSVDADLVGRLKQADLGAVASVRALEQSMGDLTARLDAYNLYAPKQARWQAELLLTDLTHDAQVGAAISNLGELSNAAVKASTNMDRMPEVLDRARANVVADVDTQRLAVQGFLQEERKQVIDALDRERIATVADLRKERIAATSDLHGESQVILGALHSEQLAAMSGLHGVSDETLKNFDTKARGLIDHFFIRALELLIIAVVLFVLAAWLLLRRFRPRQFDTPGRAFDRAA